MPHEIPFAGWGIVFCIFCCNRAIGQVFNFPYTEHFDSIPDSALPFGWTTTRYRRASGNFFESSSSPHSSPHCLYSHNSTISQSLISPTFDFTNRTPEKLQFYVARSSTHTSGLLLEASLDDGVTFPVTLSDTIKNPGTTSYVLNTIQLPALLAKQQAVKIRWRITGGTGGSTATLRIDDVSLTTLIAYDFEAATLSVLPKQATAKDSLVFTAVIKNAGIQPVGSYNVKFFIDLNANAFPESNEQFATISGTSIPAGDSVQIIAGHSPIKAGDYKLFTIVSFPKDERRSNDTASTLFSIGYPKGSLLVNEFMYAPAGDEPPCEQSSHWNLRISTWQCWF